MPNWCSTKIEFTGTTEDLTDFHNKVVEFTSVSPTVTDFEKNWLGNVLHGFDLGDRVDSENDRIRCRGAIDYIGDVDNSSFIIYTETAWIPMVHMWYVIIEKYYGNRISVHWIAEEEGCGVYETNDINWFSSDYYHLEWSVEDECSGEYYDDPEEAAEAINTLITRYSLDVKPVVEDDINSAEDNGNDFIISGDGWSITCLILREVNDTDMD